MIHMVLSPDVSTINTDTGIIIIIIITTELIHSGRWRLVPRGGGYGCRSARLSVLVGACDGWHVDAPSPP